MTAAISRARSAAHSFTCSVTRASARSVPSTLCVAKNSRAFSTRAGSQPLATNGMFAAMGGGKRSILFSTHNVEDAAALAHRVFFLVGGRIVATLPGGDAPRLADTFRRLEATA